MEKIKQSFNSLPGTLKVIIFSGISNLLGVLLVFVNDVEPFSWRKLLAVVIGTTINVVAYLSLREKDTNPPTESVG